MFSAFDELGFLIPERCCQKFRIETEFVIATNLSNQILYLNNTAGSILLLCNGINTIKDIYSKILLEYNVDSVILKNDIVRIIRDFQWNDLIELKH